MRGGDRQPAGAARRSGDGERALRASPWPRRPGPIRPAGRCGSASTSAPWSRASSAGSKFTFDLWGDTVNVAARLSDFGADGAVYLSEAAWRQLDGRARGQPLGPVALKGKGAIAVYRCEGIDV